MRSIFLSLLSIFIGHMLYGQIVVTIVTPENNLVETILIFRLSILSSDILSPLSLNPKNLVRSPYYWIRYAQICLLLGVMRALDKT